MHGRCWLLLWRRDHVTGKSDGPRGKQTATGVSGATPCQGNGEIADGCGPAIIIMAKAPVAGFVKTRLTDGFTPDEIAELAACFLADTVSRAKQTGRTVFIAYSPASGRNIIESIAGEDVRWLCQPGGDLGARMAAAFAGAAAEGFGPLVMVGTDSPNLPPASYETAFCALRSGDTDLVLGRTDDGGYYLIGMRSLCAALLEGIAWSGPTVFDQTVANAARLGMRVREILPWYDVDTPEDLDRLRQDLLGDPAGSERAPTTREWLKSH